MQKIIVNVFLFITIPLFSQNISLQECETQFLKNNLLLLANHFNIEIEKAKIIEVKTWNNPEFGFEFNAWSPNEEKKFFNAGKYGQKSAYIQQLIHIGGQRKNEIDFAKSNTQLAELDFEILLQSLKYQLRNYFFTIYFDTKSVNQINKQLTNLRSVINNYSEQEKKGNVTLKDLVRLQNVSLKLSAERAVLITDLLENKKNLEILISSETLQNITPSPTTTELENYQKPILNNIEELQKTALEKRPDYLKAVKQIEAYNSNLKLQKSLSIPDITIGAAYDQNGGTFSNETNLTLAVPLPLWNKNKGNIIAAKYSINQAELEKNSLAIEVIAEVKSAYLKYNEQKSGYELTNSNIAKNLETVYEGVYSNFLKKNITLLEFTDFLESYNESVISQNEINKSYINACEEMSYTTASKLF